MQLPKADGRWSEEGGHDEYIRCGERATRPSSTREESVVVITAFSAREKEWIDRSGVTLSDVADGKVTKQELTRPEDSAKAAQQILQGDEDDDADEHEAWESRLSATDRQILHLARAFITNPHVLVLHRQLANFDGALAQRVCNTIRNFVRNRGIPSKPGHLARTVIFSTVASNERAIETADAIIVLGKPGERRVSL